MPEPLSPGIRSPDVQILLATYNGERFLREQIDSLLAQSLPGVTILARDDGSQDSTPQILADYAARFPGRFTILPAVAPTGSARLNFLTLLRASAPGSPTSLPRWGGAAPFVALSDQDDVWLPEKLELEMQAMRALEKLHGASTPLLVFTDLQVVDDSLHTLAPSFWSHRRLNPQNLQRERIGRLLMENVLTGCTALMNAPLVRLACSMPDSPSLHPSMHDWWIALAAAIFGHAAPLDRQLVLYRQHDSNVIGASDTAPPLGLRGRLQHQRCRERWELSVHQARELLRIYSSELPQAVRANLEDLLRCEASSNPAYRLCTMFRRGYFVSNFPANLATAWFLLDKNQKR